MGVGVLRHQQHLKAFSHWSLAPRAYTTAHFCLKQQATWEIVMVYEHFSKHQSAVRTHSVRAQNLAGRTFLAVLDLTTVLLMSYMCWTYSIVSGSL
jgi:hypothetical protein